MQYCPPLYSFGYSNPTQFLSNPEIIGEGEVTSVVLPDGSVQFIFLPTSKVWPKYAYNENVYNPLWHANTGVWLIRSFSKQIPQSCWQPVNVDPFSKLWFNPTSNINETEFKLKFHNDSWTSTTDLHYFYPYIRKYNCPLSLCGKESASVQVEILTQEKCTSQNTEVFSNLCHCAIPYTFKPPTQNTTLYCKCCHYALNVETKENQCLKDQFSYDKIKQQCSYMSIDSTPKQSHEQNKSKNQCITKKKSRKGVRIRDSPCSMNKSVATYADKASNCVSDKKEQTQSCRCDPLIMTPVTEVENAPRRKNNAKNSLIIENRSSETLIDPYDTCSCTASICDYDT